MRAEYARGDVSSSVRAAGDGVVDQGPRVDPTRVEADAPDEDISPLSPERTERMNMFRDGQYLEVIKVPTCNSCQQLVVKRARARARNRRASRVNICYEGQATRSSFLSL